MKGKTMGLDIDGWMLFWTPNCRSAAGISDPGAVLVAPLSDDAYVDNRYAYTGGACYVDRREMTLAQKVMMMFIDFHTLVVRDGIDPQAAHREFLKIDEYRNRISPDTDGAAQ
jgi:hypothetical protein